MQIDTGTASPFQSADYPREALSYNGLMFVNEETE